MELLDFRYHFVPFKINFYRLKFRMKIKVKYRNKEKLSFKNLQNLVFHE